MVRLQANRRALLWKHRRRKAWMTIGQSRGIFLVPRFSGYFFFLSVLPRQPHEGTLDLIPALWPTCHSNCASFVPWSYTQAPGPVPISLTFSSVNKATEGDLKQLKVHFATSTRLSALCVSNSLLLSKAKQLRGHRWIISLLFFG